MTHVFIQLLHGRRVWSKATHVAVGSNCWSSGPDCIIPSTATTPPTCAMPMVCPCVSSAQRLLHFLRVPDFGPVVVVFGSQVGLSGIGWANLSCCALSLVVVSLAAFATLLAALLLYSWCADAALCALLQRSSLWERAACIIWTGVSEIELVLVLLAYRRASTSTRALRSVGSFWPQWVTHPRTTPIVVHDCWCVCATEKPGTVICTARSGVGPCGHPFASGPPSMCLISAQCWRPFGVNRQPLHRPRRSPLGGGQPPLRKRNPQRSGSDLSAQSWQPSSAARAHQLGCSYRSELPQGSNIPFATVLPSTLLPEPLCAKYICTNSAGMNLPERP